MDRRPHMSARILILACSCLVSFCACAQDTSQYEPPRMPDGRPDMQGFWSIATYTPLERPDDVTKEFYTPDELDEIMGVQAASEALNIETGSAGDVHYEGTQFGLDRSQAALARHLRTSQIVTPRDGKIPAQTPEGKARTETIIERLARQTDAAEYNTVEARCLVFRGAGPPMFDAGYNNNVHIVQTAGYVVLFVEMIHDARIIPLHDFPAPHENVRQWLGVSRGHWEGDSLVVQTTNFNGKNQVRELRHTGRGSSENLRVTERFTRVADDEILYSFTVEDPTTWVAPWTAETPLAASVGPMFEFACHEGNRGLYNSLNGARVDEQRADDAGSSNVN